MLKQAVSFLVFVILTFFCYQLLSGQVADTLTYRKTLSETNIAHALLTSPAVNPAYTGLIEGYNLTAHAFFNKPFFEYFGLLDLPRQIGGVLDFSFGKQKNNAIGLYYIEDVGGAVSLESYGLTYARRIELEGKSFTHHIRLGASFSYHRRNFEWNKLTFMDMIDAKHGFVYNTSELRGQNLRTYVKFDFGLWYQNPYFFAGLSSMNLTEPDLSYYGTNKQYRRIELTSGGILKLGPCYTLHPVFSAQVNSLAAKNEWLFSPGIVGAYNNRIYAGVIYRNTNSISVVAGAAFYKGFFFSVFCGMPTHEHPDAFGLPSYIGGSFRTNINP